MSLELAPPFRVKAAGSAIALFGALAILGCDSQPTEALKYHPEPVLTGFLTNGLVVSEIFLERVHPLAAYYDRSLSGIVGATMTITGGGDSLRLEHDSTSPGRYVPEDGDSLVPRGNTRYRIEATTPGGEFVWAETVVPDTFAWVSIYLMGEDGVKDSVRENDTLTRQDPNMFWEWSGVESAGGYAGMIIAQTPRDSLVPLDPDWDAAKDSVAEEQRTRTGFTIMRDDQRKITIAWIFFQWEGPQRIELQAISRDYYEYLFSSFSVQMGLIEKAQTNIHGGFGIFAGLAKRTLMVNMRRVE